MSDIVEHKATPRAELERQIMDPNISKNEREWWAAAEVERLQEHIATLQELRELDRALIAQLRTALERKA